MFAIYKKELSAFFSNASGYIVIGIFLLLCGIFLWLIPGSFNVFDSGYANLSGLFYLAPWLFLFLIPAICMRFFAEEKQNGNWELLRSKPLNATQLVSGKYLAGLSLASLSLIPTIIYYASVAYMAQPTGNVDAGQFWGSFIGLFFLASAYTAISIFASSISGNQITAFILSVALCFAAFYGFELASSFISGGKGILFFENLGIHAHYKSMSRGVIDSRDLGYFFLVIILFLFATTKIIDSNRQQK